MSTRPALPQIDRLHLEVVARVGGGAGFALEPEDLEHPEPAAAFHIAANEFRGALFDGHETAPTSLVEVARCALLIRLIPSPVAGD